MNDIAVRLAEAIADEANTIAKYSRDYIAINELNDKDSGEVLVRFVSIISEELKHVLEFTQEYVRVTGIEPEDYEVVKDDESNSL